MRLRIVSHGGSDATEKSAPEMKNIGMIAICMTAMNDCIWVMRAAAVMPKAVIANASSSCRPKISSSSVGA